MGTDSEIGDVILFDGVCNLCNASVDFVIRRDRKKRFQFAPLQSGIAKDLLKGRMIDPTKLDGIILVQRDGSVSQKSTAALKVAAHLGGLWPVLYVFIWLPRILRDTIYDFIAKYRYAWFGKKDTCRLPTSEERDRFLG